MSDLASLLAKIQAEGAVLLSTLGSSVSSSVNNISSTNPFDKSPSTYNDPAYVTAQRLVSTCQHLVSVLTPSRIQALHCCFSGSLPTAIGVACHFKVADVIEDRGGRAELGAIAQRVGTDAIKLGNVLRTLTAHHTFVEETPGVFANNRHSRVFLSGEGAPEVLEFYALTAGQALTGLLPLLNSSEQRSSIAARDSAFGHAFGVHQSVMEWVSEPAQKPTFDKLMTGLPWLDATSAEGVVDQFAWDAWGAEARVCDMGCANGGMMSLLKASKRGRDLRIVCQDLEGVVGSIRKTFEKDHPDALARGEVKIMVHDYFTPQSEPADVYYLRGVIHDYTDDDCVTILKQLKPQLEAQPERAVLVNEIVVPQLLHQGHPDGRQGGGRGKEEEQYEERCSAFSQTTSMMQLHALSFLGGRERTFVEFEEIFRRAGLRVRRFVRLQLYTAIMEIGL